MTKSKLKDPCLRDIHKKFQTFYKWGWQMYSSRPTPTQEDAEAELLKDIKTTIGIYDTLRRKK